MLDMAAAPTPEALDVLEARVATLEARVFGRGAARAAAMAATAAPGRTSGAGGDTRPAAPSSQNVVDALVAANAFLAAATSGREKVASVLHRRLGELESYLRTATAAGVGAGEGDERAGLERAAAARWPLVQREEETLREAAQQLRRLAELRPALDPQPLAAALDLRPRLAALAADTDRQLRQAHELAAKAAELQEQEKIALESATHGLAIMEAKVSRLEVAAMPRQPLD